MGWLADYCIHNLVFIKQELGVTDESLASDLVEAFWQALKLLDYSSNENFKLRYDCLVTHLNSHFKSKKISRDQVRKSLAYAKKSLFGHF